MSSILHLKDPFGNDMYFGDAGDVKTAAVPDVDYSNLLQSIRDVTLRDDDVIVVGYPKSGNNWTHHIVSMLKAGTTDLPPLFNEGDFPFLDAIDKGSNKHPPAADKPRVLLSHMFFRFLPADVMRKKVKIVYVTRNPRDVMVSMYNHVSGTRPPIGYEGTWPQFFHVMLRQGYWYGHVMDHLMDWQREMEAHPAQPILRCSYEDMKEDTVGQVERLNQFLGTGRDRQLCEAIVHTCRLDNMAVTRQQSQDNFKNLWLWKEGKGANFYRKGMVGDWKNWFTVAQNEQFDDVYTTKMADYKYKFRYE